MLVRLLFSFFLITFPFLSACAFNLETKVALANNRNLLSYNQLCQISPSPLGMPIFVRADSNSKSCSSLHGATAVFRFKKDNFAPLAYSGKLSLPVIVLDAGHGGTDEGCKIKSPRCEEKRLSLITTYLAKRYLERKGYKVILTRYRDNALPLNARVDKANRLNAEIFVSIHFNSCPTPKVSGIEIYYPAIEGNYRKREASRKLAVSILNATLTQMGALSRGVRKKDFVVIRDTNMPAVLVEGGFLTNAEERDKLRKKAYLDKLAKGIANGIDTFVDACTK
jgi:N-acetylmuramoyl-L-alanine amidase